MKLADIEKGRFFRYSEPIAEGTLSGSPRDWQEHLVALTVADWC